MVVILKELLLLSERNAIISSTGGFSLTSVSNMASLSQLVSEMAHSLRQPNNKALRENLKLLIIHTRNEVIRRSYENHSYVDKSLVQRYKVTLTTIKDGDPSNPSQLPDDMTIIKRTTNQVPKPVRLINNLPFDRVSTAGFKTNKEIPFIKETSARFRSHLPGMCAMPAYDYINGFIYIFPADEKSIDFDSIVIESAFEHPTPIDVDNGLVDPMDAELNENEWVLSEDMIGQITEIINKRNLLDNIRETNEIPNNIKF